MEPGLFSEFDIPCKNTFPSTRYQGSKAKFVDWIWYEISDIKFQTALDAFGGTGSVAYKLKEEGKTVTYNDILPFNTIIGKALIENNSTILTETEVEDIISEQKGVCYPTFITDNFKDIYYTDDENHWLDVVSHNISLIKDGYKQALAWFALFQSCIIKRPYNLFHRKNLYVRFSDVKRSFGNKRTWDTPFEIHFKKFIKEANQAVFDNKEVCIALNSDALDLPNEYDLVYIDTPYINKKGVGVDYADFYHFLDGLVNYNKWSSLIDFQSKHRRLKRKYSIWNDKEEIINGFCSLINHFKESILVISYRSNGFPSIELLRELIESKGRSCDVRYSKEIKYALSDSKSREVLIITTPS